MPGQLESPRPTATRMHHGVDHPHGDAQPGVATHGFHGGFVSSRSAPVFVMGRRQAIDAGPDMLQLGRLDFLSVLLVF